MRVDMHLSCEARADGPHLHGVDHLCKTPHGAARVDDLCPTRHGAAAVDGLHLHCEARA